MGMQKDIGEHIQNFHKGSFYNYFHSATLKYNPIKSIRTFNLIDAFNKKFVFYYDAKASGSTITFMIFLIGRKYDAQKYLVDFELKNGVRKWKCVELCYCDADNLDEHINEQRCFAIPKKVFESFVVNDLVEYRFNIKRKETLEEEEKTQGKHSWQNGYGRGGLNRTTFGGSTMSLGAIGHSSVGSTAGGIKSQFFGAFKQSSNKPSRSVANNGHEKSEKIIGQSSASLTAGGSKTTFFGAPKQSSNRPSKSEANNGTEKSEKNKTKRQQKKR